MVVGLCKMAMLWAILPALAEASVGAAETSESIKAECEANFECTVERLRRSSGSSWRTAGKSLHRAKQTQSNQNVSAPFAHTDGHRLSNGLCAPRRC